MSPGGHLVTTAGACAVSAVVTHGAPLAASLPVLVGIALGGFLIDVDHVVDYVAFDRQRDLRPQAFLRYFLEGRVRRTVLVLHSYELFALLALAAWWTQNLLLTGYLVGGLMHLALDIRFNGELTPRSIVAFYSFGYRLAYGFDARALLGPPGGCDVPAGFWPAFFRGPVPVADAGMVPPGAVPEPVRVRDSD